MRYSPLLTILCLAAFDAFGQSATTEAATGVTDVQATLRGTVVPGSTTNYRYPKFEYWTDGGAILTINAEPYDVIGNNPVAVTANPPELQPNTTYHYRVVMSSSILGGGGWIGGDMTFTTAAPTTLPSFQSAYAQIIGDTLVNFLIWNTRSGGSPATTTFEYGTTPSYGSQVTLPDTMATNTTRSSAQINATGLTPGTLYHYRVKVTNDQGTTTSADATFTTTLPATVTTGAATNVTCFSASVAGTATPLAHTLGLFFQYGPTTDYGSTANGTPSQISGAGTTDVSGSLTNLLPGTTYHYRLRGADFWNGGGYYDGEDMTFTTPSNVTTLPANGVTDLAATVNGTVLTNGSGTTFSYVFEYGPTASYGQTRFATLVQNDTANPNLKIVSASMPSLLPGTEYHYRLRFTQNGHTTYGENVSFTTAAAATPPVITSPGQSLSPRYATAANLSAVVQAGSSETTVVFEYGPDASYGFEMAVPGTFSVNSSSVTGVTVSGLVPASTYHFRVRATNTEGASTSDDATFITLSPPDVTTNAATNVGATWATLNGTYHMREGNYTVTFEYGATTDYGSVISPGGIIIGGGGGGGIIIIGGGGGNNSVQNPAATPANLVIGTTYHYRLKLTDGIGVSYFGADSTFTTVTASEAWRQNYFGSAANAGEAADLETPANDRMPNLLKYALGLDPRQPAVPPMMAIVGDPGDERLSLTFSRLIAATDVTIEVQAANSLDGPWTTISASSGGGSFFGTAQVTQTGVGLVFPGPSYPTGTDMFQVRDTVPIGSTPRRFLRLRVTR